MPIFKRKEKNLIPEVEPVGRGGSPAGGGPASSSSFGRSGKKEQPDPEGFEKLPGRRYQRDQYNYQPPSSSSAARAQQPGGYGNYGSYGQQQPQASQQPPPVEGSMYGGQGSLSGAGGYQQQQGGGGGGGYGGYDNNARSNLFKGARAPAQSTGASFDRYASDGRGSGGARTPQDNEGDEGEGVLSGNQETEEDDEV